MRETRFPVQVLVNCAVSVVFGGFENETQSKSTVPGS